MSDREVHPVFSPGRQVGEVRQTVHPSVVACLPGLIPARIEANRLLSALRGLAGTTPGQKGVWSNR